MKQNSALTLVELLLVIALIGLVSLPLYFSYTRSQAKQTLRSSAEQLANNLRLAHVFAREAKDKKPWGVVRSSETSYSLVSGNENNSLVNQTLKVEAFVKLPQDFKIFFDIGTGEAKENSTVFLENAYGIKMKVLIFKTGLIEVVGSNE